MFNKNYPRFVLLLFFIFCNGIVEASSGYAISNGDWDDSPTWLFGSTNRKPGCADTVTIGAGKTVTVNTQENLFPCGVPNIIYVDGILEFTNGNKLDLPCGSLVIIRAGGLVKKATAGGGNSTLISICGVVEWRAGDGPLSGPDTLGTPAPLPVTMLLFNAHSFENRVDLNWITATELNNGYFLVTRSADAISFETLGTVDGSGNSTQQINYGFTDILPLQGISYYRLLQVDYDGRVNRSQIIAVNRKSRNTTSLYIHSGSVNPSAVYTSLRDGQSDLVVINATGDVVSSSKVFYKEGINTIEIPSLISLASGIYFARIIDEDGTATQAKFFIAGR